MASVIPNSSVLRQELKRDHLLHELGSWQRSLEFYKQENSFLKVRLSEIVDRTDEKQFLKKAELFQNKFLQNDVGLEKIQQKTEGFTEELRRTAADDPRLGILQEKQEKFRRLFFQYEQNLLLLIKEFNEEILKPHH